MLIECGVKGGQPSLSFEVAEAFRDFHHPGGGPAQGHPRVAPGFTLRQTCRITAFIDLMMLVLAKDLRNSLGRHRRVTVKISSRPSRMLFDTLGASNSSRRARLRRSRSALISALIARSTRVPSNEMQRAPP